MTKEENIKLCEKYPFLKMDRNLGSGEIIPDYDYSVTGADELPEGWRENFGNKIGDELTEILKIDKISDFHFEEIKEKYGTLRLYYYPYTDRLEKWSSKYEDLSEKICIHCGKPAEYYISGGITFVCKDCADAIHKERGGNLNKISDKEKNDEQI